MVEAEINLTEQERSALQDISRRTGKTEGELIREAVNHLIAEFQDTDRRVFLQRARGIWKERHDLPALKDLRREWNRC